MPCLYSVTIPIYIFFKSYLDKILCWEILNRGCSSGERLHSFLLPSYAQCCFKSLAEEKGAPLWGLLCGLGKGRWFHVSIGTV